MKLKIGNPLMVKLCYKKLNKVWETGSDMKNIKVRFLFRTIYRDLHVKSKV